jgi:GH18 family chitinase
MIPYPGFALALSVGSFMLSVNQALVHASSRFASSPVYGYVDPCPERCRITGPSTANWSAYPNFNHIKKCEQTMFYDFSLYGSVDDQSINHRIQACSSFGPDFAELPGSADGAASAQTVNIDLEIGWWDEGFGLAASGIRSLVSQLRTHAGNAHAATDRPFILFGQSGQATIGLYVGQSLLNQGISVSALKIFEDNLENLNVLTTSLAMQLCGPNHDSNHIFGIMATSNGTFTPLQDAIKTWSNSSCLDFKGSVNLTTQARFTAPALSSNGTIESTSLSTPSIERKRNQQHRAHQALQSRAECRTVQVKSGDSCASLATECGISPVDLTKYNTGSGFCASLKPKQHVCCSSGNLPNFSPSPNADGSCYSYQAKTDDNCDDLAAQFGLTRDLIETFNKKTWGWNGCKLLYIGTKMCLSKGTPPFPATIPNAVCGPQKPGSTPPTDGSDIADLNQCPLNACCNIWGQCGITKDFCVDTNTGAPGTAKSGSYGCISNCGTDIVKGDKGPTIKVGYFEGYGMNRDCLLQDASQIDTSQYTHVHFAFATLTSDYEVKVGDLLSSYQFGEFKRLEGVKRILSFGGWDFSASPATYAIFRTGVTSANRLKMAKNIANFIREHELDGVDIDWEYPGAPDLPDIPAASKDDGPNYLAFLAMLKIQLHDKSVSIAAPSSYWYLKQFPIKNISQFVDYIVYMTYDLHGQWDTGNGNSQEGCDMGNCLRSQVNLTETKQSLAMITKAGVPGNKVVVGITSYGRSYSMADEGCWGPNCFYTGGRGSSDATKGKCTDTAGYIADAEILDIIKDRKRSGRVIKDFVDSGSHSNILIYDNNQWISYMSSDTKKQRAALYSAWGMAGTTDWATDLQKYHDVPAPAKNWKAFKTTIKSGLDPKTDNTRNGNWTDLDCTNPAISDWPDYTPTERWRLPNSDAAWEDAIRIWENTDRKQHRKFTVSLSHTFKVGAEADCGDMTSKICDSARDCSTGMDGPYSGPAGYLIWNSLVEIRNVFTSYQTALTQALAIASTSLRDLENKFAPIPPVKDNSWVYVMVDLLTLGTLTAAGPFFNSFLKAKAYFSVGSALDTTKDTALTLIGQSTTLAKDLFDTSGKDPKWTPEKQDSFSGYVGRVVNGWLDINSKALQKMFDGSEDSIENIWKIISDGKLLKGKTDTEAPDSNKDVELRTNIGKTIFGHSIPALWKVSQTYAFIMDAGNSCGERDSLKQYLDETTMDATGACIDGKAYYLVYPKDESRPCKCDRTSNDGHPCIRSCSRAKFSAPPGLDTLDGTLFGGITKKDLIEGSLNTYRHNGNKNDAPSADPFDRPTMETLLDIGIKAPGYVRIPVCSPERAFQSWDTAKAGSSPNYPCDRPPGVDACAESSFENKSSDASPLIEDCQQIIRNIIEDSSTSYTVSTAGHSQQAIVHHKSCHLGVEAAGVLDGNINFKVGGQDVIDLINDAVKQFGGNGKIGAQGFVKCNGNLHQQSVKWGIY